MNNAFSFYRLKLLFQKDWAENRNIYLLSIPVMSLIIILVYLIIGGDFKSQLQSVKEYKHEYWHYQNEGIYTVGLFLISLLNVVLRVNKLANKRAITEYLLTPSSASEKLALNWIWSFPVLFIVYTILFQIVDHPFITYYIESAKEAKVYNLAEGLTYFNLNHCIKENWEGLGWFLIIFSSLLLSPFHFKRYAIIKGLITILLFIYMLSTLSNHLLQRAFPFYKSVNGLFFRASGRIPDDRYFTFLLSHNQNLLIGSLLFCLLPVLIWIINWYKIKEKQV